MVVFQPQVASGQIDIGDQFTGDSEVALFLMDDIRGAKLAIGFLLALFDGEEYEYVETLFIELEGRLDAVRLEEVVALLFQQFEGGRLGQEELTTHIGQLGLIQQSHPQTQRQGRQTLLQENTGLVEPMGRQQRIYLVL